MNASRRKPSPPSEELRAALAGLALQGLLANPDISARMLANIDNEGTAVGGYVSDCVTIAATASARLLEELSK